MTKEEQDNILKILKDEIIVETFIKDEEEFSPQRVAVLVNMIELLDPSVDEDEIRMAQKRLEKKLKKKSPYYYFRKAGQIAAIICLLILGVNITTEATMNRSIIHVIQSWNDRYCVIPGDNEIKAQENNITFSSNVQEFAQIFNEDFLICTTIPQGYTLNNIQHAGVDSVHDYLWCYSKAGEEDIFIHIYKKNDKDISSYTGSCLEKIGELKCENGLTAIICKNSDEYIAYFEYGNWWYVIQAPEKNEMINIIEGMEKYNEKN